MIAEARFYNRGWSFRLGLLQLRYNRQEMYRGLSVEWVKSSYLASGGMTWRQFRAARKQAAAADRRGSDGKVGTR